MMCKLGQRPLRFSELKRQLPSITDRMLILPLRELDHDQPIARLVFAEAPPGSNTR